MNFFLLFYIFKGGMVANQMQLLSTHLVLSCIVTEHILCCMAMISGPRRNTLYYQLWYDRKFMQPKC